MNKTKAGLQEANEKLTGLLESITDAFVALDSEWRYTFINRHAEKVLQKDRGELLNRNIWEQFPELAGTAFEHECRRAVEEQRPVEFHEFSSPLGKWFEKRAYPLQGGLALSFKDITTRKLEEEKLLSLSLKDELTGLYNRRGFLILAEEQVKLVPRKEKGLLLVFADLDGLKEINDGFGHEEGDNALINVAGILRKAFRGSDIIGRIGGDEFTIMAIDAMEESASLIDAHVQQTLKRYNAGVRQHPYELKISTGIAYMNPRNPISMDEFLCRADQRLYDNKRARKAGTLNG